MNMPEKPFIYNYKRLEEPRNSRIRRPRRNLQRIVSSLPLNLSRERSNQRPFAKATRGTPSPKKAFGIKPAGLPPEALAKGGGARRIRTDDILLAKQALYQLSYGPFAKG